MNEAYSNGLVMFLEDTSVLAAPGIDMACRKAIHSIQSRPSRGGWDAMMFVFPKDAHWENRDHEWLLNNIMHNGTVMFRAYPRIHFYTQANTVEACIRSISDHLFHMRQHLVARPHPDNGNAYVDGSRMYVDVEGLTPKYHTFINGCVHALVQRLSVTSDNDNCEFYIRTTTLSGSGYLSCASHRLYPPGDSEYREKYSIINRRKT